MPSNILLDYQGWLDAQEPDIEWLIPPFMAKGDAAIFHGPPQAMKSFYAMRLCLDLATGQPILGRWPVQEPAPVVLFQGEGSSTAWQARLRAVRERYGGAPNFHSFHSLTLKADSQKGIKIINDIIDDIRPALVVFDPLVKWFMGDDSDPIAVQRWTDLLDRWREAYRTAVLIIQHDRQQQYGFDKGKPVALDQGFAEARGRSELPAWADFGVSLRKKEGFGVMRVEKVRDAEYSDPYMYKWQDGLVVPVDDDSSVQKLTLALLTDQGPMGRSRLIDEIRKEIDMSVRQVYRHLDKLVAQGVLDLDEQGKNKVLISIKEK